MTEPFERMPLTSSDRAASERRPRESGYSGIDLRKSWTRGRGVSDRSAMRNRQLLREPPRNKTKDEEPEGTKEMGHQNGHQQPSRRHLGQVSCLVEVSERLVGSPAFKWRA